MLSRSFAACRGPSCSVLPDENAAVTRSLSHGRPLHRSVAASFKRDIARHVNLSLQSIPVFGVAFLEKLPWQFVTNPFPQC
jgi:hypothetical protein